MQSLFHHIASQADTTHLPTYISVDDMTQTTQSLHLSDLLDYDEDGSSSRMLPGSVNNDFDIGGSPHLQLQIKQIIHNYQDIFSHNVKLCLFHPRISFQ